VVLDRCAEGRLLLTDPVRVASVPDDTIVSLPVEIGLPPTATQ
jgi:hypothetical protein